MGFLLDPNDHTVQLYSITGLTNPLYSISSSSFPYFLSLWFLAFLFFHFIFAVPPMEIFPGGSSVSPSKEVNKGDIIIKIVHDCIMIMTNMSDQGKCKDLRYYT